jgi:hypothetical protein
VGDLVAVESRRGGEGRRRDGGLEVADPSGNRVLLVTGG